MSAEDVEAKATLLTLKIFIRRGATAFTSLSKALCHGNSEALIWTTTMSDRYRS
jgi:hypothetical protein